jgi:hypothetical protein
MTTYVDFVICSVAEVDWAQATNRLTEKVCSWLKELYKLYSSFIIFVFAVVFQLPHVQMD